MARIRSPGYPSFGLEDVVEFARKIHAEDRQHPVDRDTAARHMGFSGLSGASDRALSALMHFGFAEKVQKGEIRVTDLALKIVHPDSPAERRNALHEAGFAPGLFQELRTRYPDAPPSKDGLSSFLSRSGFASAAIGPATKAYLETCYFLQREGAYESGGNDAAVASEPTQEPIQESAMPPPPVERPVTASSTAMSPAAFMSGAAPALNKINMNVKGAQVHLEALLDRKGIAALKKKLTSLEALLDDEDDDYGRPDDEDLDPRD
jgi:hypothetical protein